MPLDTLDELSRSIVVEVDNAVRTSENELALAVEEFGERETAPFTAAVNGARTTLAQAFNVRQILDDAVRETPQQRRDLLTPSSSPPPRPTANSIPSGRRSPRCAIW